MDPIKFFCLYCGKPLEMDREYAGKSGNCPYCQKPLVVPLPDPRVEGQWRAVPPPLPNPPLATVPYAASPPTGRPPERQPSAVAGCAGWFATVFLGFMGISIGIAVDPLWLLLISAPALLLCLYYLTIRKSRNTVGFPVGRLAVILAIAVLISATTLKKRADDRASAIEAEAELRELIAHAQRAHDAGDLQSALKILSRRTDIAEWWRVPESVKHEERDLEDGYKKELGQTLAPELANLIDKANASIAAGDKPNAIDLLTRATASQFEYTPRYKEAEELLDTVRPG